MEEHLLQKDRLNSKYFIIFTILVLNAAIAKAQSTSIEVWIRSFIPNVANAGAASHNILNNPNGSGSIVEVNLSDIPLNHPYLIIIKRFCIGSDFNRICFATDNRGFSSDPGTTARTDTKFTITLNANGTASIIPSSVRTITGITKRLDCATGSVLEQKAGKIDSDAIGRPAVAGDVVQVIGQITATDQLVPCAPTLLTPSADCSFDLKWNRSTTELNIDFTFGVFPAFEIYARQPGNEWIPVFQQLPLGTAWQLAGDGLGINTVRKSLTVKVPGLSGKWQSPAPEQRFTIEINGSTAKWTERNLSGTTLMKEVPIRLLDNGDFRIERANDNEVLSFLGYQPSLRSEILAKGPQPSFMLFHAEGTNIRGEWNGLVAIKDANARLKELIQPGVRPPKVLIFSKF